MLTTCFPEFQKMASELREKIYGTSRADFSPGYPSKCEAMQHYIWCLEEEYRLKNTNRLDDKNPLRDTFVANLRTHWSNQPNPKPVLDKVDVNKKVKPLIDFYWELKNKKHKLMDQAWIDDQKEKLLPILDIEKRTVATAAKKRPIEEVNKVIIKNVF